MNEPCPHLKCYRWNEQGRCMSGRRSRCLRVRLERGDPFPIADADLYDRDQAAWATEVFRLWRNAGTPTLVGGVAPEQLHLARGILGIHAPNTKEQAHGTR